MGYDEPEILSYAISPFCPTSADGLQYYTCSTKARQGNTGWTIFVSLWTTLVGYTAAVLFYQTATFARHPASSTWWIAGIAAVLIAVVWTMWYVGKRDKTEKAVIVPGV